MPETSSTTPLTVYSKPFSKIVCPAAASCPNSRPANERHSTARGMPERNSASVKGPPSTKSKR